MQIEFYFYEKACFLYTVFCSKNTSKVNLMKKVSLAAEKVQFKSVIQ